jgi:uncharacterized protein YbjT (DUF2867 family)
MFVVTGATGNTGSVVAETLLAAGAKVRVVVRDAAKAEAWKQRGAEVALAAFDDAAALTRAFAGAKGLYLMTPPLPMSPDMIAERAPMIAALTKAAKDAAVPHIVVLSSIGAQHATGTGPIVSLYALEKGLANTGAKLTILRPGYFADNWAEVIPVALAQGILPSTLAPERKMPMPSTRDIARIAAEALLHPPARTQIIGITGPADASPADVAAALAKLIGKPVQMMPVPSSERAAALQAAGLPAKSAALYAEMCDAVDSGFVGYEGTEIQKRGSEPLAETLKRLLPKA